MRKMRKNSWPGALPLAGGLKRAAGGLFALALGLLAPAGTAADYLIIEGGSGSSADTHVLDGAPGALAADNIVGEGEGFVAVKASGRGNVMDNHGKALSRILTILISSKVVPCSVSISGEPSAARPFSFLA